MRGSYQTKQREYILKYLFSHSEHPLSAKEIYTELKSAGTSIGLATIYRQLEQLVTEQKIKKIMTDKAGAQFQYLQSNHIPDTFFLKCERCGKLTQVDCGMLTQVAKHIDTEHGLQINIVKSLFYGLCGNCRTK